MEKTTNKIKNQVDNENVFYLGVMLEISPLTRLLPDTDASNHISEFFSVEDDDGGVITFTFSAAMAMGSTILMLGSGIRSHIRSSSWTTSAIEGRASVSFSQHLRAKVANITKHSEGQGPIPLSITENIIPD
jgi:gamma-glutamyltranspeptidase